jgi:hypothetical protein
MPIIPATEETVPHPKQINKLNKIMGKGMDIGKGTISQPIIQSS